MRFAELQRLVEATPEGSSVSFTFAAAELREALAEVSAGVSEPLQAAPAPVADLTVPELSQALQKHPSTVRALLPSVAGAYKLAGEWRISREHWRAYLDTLAETAAEERNGGPRPGAPLRRDPGTFRWAEPQKSRTEKPEASENRTNGRAVQREGTI